MNIQDTLALPDKALVGFKHVPTGMLYVTYTRQCFTFYMHQMRMLRDGVHPSAFLQNNKHDMEFIIIEALDNYLGDAVGKELLKSYPKSDWLRDIPVPVYRKKSILEISVHQHVRVVACLVDSRYKRTRIATFNKIKESEDFLANNNVLDLLKIAYNKH